MTSESEILNRLIALEQWTEVHHRVCQIEKEVASQRLDAVLYEIEKVSMRQERLANRALTIGGTVMLLLVAANAWFIKDALSAIRTFSTIAAAYSP